MEGAEKKKTRTPGCREFSIDDSVNPFTMRKITKNGIVYKRLKEECSSVAAKKKAAPEKKKKAPAAAPEKKKKKKKALATIIPDEAFAGWKRPPPPEKKKKKAPAEIIPDEAFAGWKRPPRRLPQRAVAATSKPSRGMMLNPKTNRYIKIGGKTHKELMAAVKMPLVLPPTPSLAAAALEDDDLFFEPAITSTPKKKKKFDDDLSFEPAIMSTPKKTSRVSMSAPPRLPRQLVSKYLFPPPEIERKMVRAASSDNSLLPSSDNSPLPSSENSLWTSDDTSNDVAGRFVSFIATPSSKKVSYFDKDTNTIQTFDVNRDDYEAELEHQRRQLRSRNAAEKKLSARPSMLQRLFTKFAPSYL